MFHQAASPIIRARHQVLIREGGEQGPFGGSLDPPDNE